MVADTVTSADRIRRRGAQESPPQDVLVARQPIVGMLQDDAERILGEMLSGGPPPSAVDVVPPARWSAASVRHYLHVAEGEGYWDFYKPWTALMLSVTDAIYRSDTWVRVEGTDYFKLRVLLSGTLRARSGEVIARAPEALLYVSPGASREGYYIAATEPVRMVVLHCRPNLLSRVLGLELSDIPPPLNALFMPGRGAAHQRLTSSPEMIHVAARIVQSRPELSRALRDRHLQTLSIELLLQVLGVLENRSLVPGPQGASARDMARIYEARDYLSQHYANPPNIPQLARMIGLNRTKLKESFRDTLGFTIYEYIVRRRMERAAEMLVTGDYGVAQVAYAVGYEYPANFTAAFKRHFGQLPHTWKRQHLGH
ncbi:MAG TPA: AraC family transcriptional regulator [Steroidobacteraceae bacterium]|nr:AraC family transcriptional regulator [Steroidobacteraceae bacterium]